jgi:hypothetical protein
MRRQPRLLRLLRLPRPPPLQQQQQLVTRGLVTLACLSTSRRQLSTALQGSTRRMVPAQTAHRRAPLGRPAIVLLTASACACRLRRQQPQRRQRLQLERSPLLKGNMARCTQVTCRHRSSSSSSSSSRGCFCGHPRPRQRLLRLLVRAGRLQLLCTGRVGGPSPGLQQLQVLALTAARSSHRRGRMPLRMPLGSTLRAARLRPLRQGRFAATVAARRSRLRPAQLITKQQQQPPQQPQQQQPRVMARSTSSRGTSSRRSCWRQTACRAQHSSSRSPTTSWAMPATLQRLCTPRW